MPSAICVRDLVKTYGSLRALDGVSFEVPAGEVFALLGPNGAGKTTTIEILEGYRKPDGGEVSVLGLDPARNGSELKPQIGVMLQEAGLYPAITPREALALWSTFYPHPRSADDLLSLLGLEDAARTRYRRLSGGQKQRLKLALSLVGRPRVVFLDEPTTGLDPQARRGAWEIISSLRDSGVTVVLTTHYLEEAERLADRVGIMNGGRLVALGSPAALLRGDATRVHVRTDGPIPVAGLSSLPAARGVRQDAEGYVVETEDAAALLEQITRWLRSQGVLATELRVGEGSLEDLFLQISEGVP